MPMFEKKISLRKLTKSIQRAEENTFNALIKFLSKKIKKLYTKFVENEIFRKKLLLI